MDGENLFIIAHLLVIENRQDIFINKLSNDYIILVMDKVVWPKAKSIQ